MNVHYRINTITAGLLLGGSLLIDALQFVVQPIPGVGIVVASIVSPVAWFCSFMIFRVFLGIDYGDTRRLATALTGPIIELVPILNILPGFTLTTAIMIILVRREDRKLAEMGTEKFAARQAQMRRILDARDARAKQERQARAQAAQTAIQAKQVQGEEALGVA